MSEGNVAMKGWAGQAAAMVSIWALCLTTGCGNFWVYPGSTTSGTGTTGSGDYVYVANTTTQNVAAFEVGTGSLTAISGSPFPLGFAPTAAVVNPADSLLFIASNDGIYSYSISSTGVLALLSSGVASGVPNVVSMAVSPDGQWLFALAGVATANILTVYEFQINSSTGALAANNSLGQTYTGTYTITAPASPIVPPVPYAVTVAQVASGEYLFAALGTGGTFVVPFNTSTGVQVLTAATQYLPLAGSNNPASNYYVNDALAVNSSASVLYVATSNTSASNGVIAAYTIGSNGTNGTLTFLASGATGFLPGSVVLNSAGADIYVGNQTGNSISAFNTTASGSSLPVLYTTSGLAYAPTGLAVDRSGDYLLAIANGGGPDMTMYSYDSTTTGKLDEAASNPTGTDPTNPVAIATTH
jgi:6-phosphogluconolactonase